MKSLRTFLLRLGVALGLVRGVVAQESLADWLNAPDVRMADPAQRAQVVEKARVLSEQRKAAAQAKAAQLGLEQRLVLPNGRVFEIMDFIGNRPLYFTTHNVNAAISSGANLLRAAPYSVDGAGLTVGVWDGGGARSTHQEFGGRVMIKDSGALVDHSTHVAGTIAAAGVDAAAKGMAPSVSVDSYEWTSDKSEMTSRGASFPGEAGKIYLSNHSYGFVTGWNYTGLSSPRWNWYGSGTTSTSIEPDFGKYETNARDTDSMAFSLPYYLILRSAGNDRADNPTAGEPVSLTTSTTSAVAYNPASHPAGDGVYRGNGYDTIGYDAVAKNVLTVGSVADAVSGGVRQPANAAMEYYSSWGPTDDGRIKPDVVANGQYLYSSFAGNDSAYGIMSGTSMATPSTTGSAALLVNWWNQLFPGHVMRASTLKALLIHTADDRGNPGPDYQYGWGLINVKAAADLAQAYKNSPGTRRVIEDQITTTAITRSYSFTWDGSSPIRATLCWTDPAGASTTTSDLRTARLVNNLDLKINGPGGTLHQPYVMPFVGSWTVANLSAPATTGVNNTDNVEQVYISAPPAAGVYTAVVTYSGTLTNAAQNFSLILSGGVASASAAAPTASAVAPNSITGGSTGSKTLNVTGTGFQLGANVKLTKTGQPDVVATGQEIRGENATARVDVSGMAAGQWNVVLTNPDGQSVTMANAFTVIGSIWSEQFESGGAGWTHSAASGYGLDTWALSTAQSHSTTHSYFASGPGSKNMCDLNSPVIAIPAGATNLQLSFWRYYSTSSTRDGVVLEFSVDGGAWFDVIASGSGAAFATGGYTGTLTSSTSPIVGRSAWTGTGTTWTQTVINLTDNTKYPGHNLQLRWRMATNQNGASTGFYLDDLILSGATAPANLPPSVATAAAATPSPVSGLTTQLTVLGSDDAGEAGLTYTWSAVGGTFERPVSFSENGTNAAKNTTATFAIAGSYTFTVTVRDAAGLTATDTVDVVVDQTATIIAVTPSSATISYGGTQAFSASVLDQFSDPLTVQPSVAWGTSGGGSISAGGVFTAGTVGGPFTITATSGAISGTAGATVTKAAATVTLGSLTQTYTGTARAATATTSPGGLGVSFTYNGSAMAPVDHGSYAVLATVNDANYAGSASGTLNITGQPLADWIPRYFTPEEIVAGLADDTADPDGDGLSNLAEYGLGTDPRAYTQQPGFLLDGNGLTMVFTRPKALPDVTYSAECSHTFGSWNPLALELLTDGPTQTLRARDPLTSGDPSSRFIRLRFSR